MLFAFLALALAASACRAQTTGTAPLTAGLRLPSGFTGEIVANVPNARELAFAPNGDLFVGSEGDDVYIVAHADASGGADSPRVYWRDPDGDAPNAGVTFVASEHAVYVGSNTAVWRLDYRAGDPRPLSATRIARVRMGPVAPHSDGDIHQTTSLAFTGGTLYVSVGSSCNACREVDPTRASLLAFSPDGGAYTKKARRIRNAIALAVNPRSGHLWVAGAGQDDLAFGHPYEFADDLSAHAGIADYGWPDCEEDRVAYVRGADCRDTVVPLVEIPAYSTIIGATFYPFDPHAKYAFPASYRGGLFLAAHGSWHRTTAGADAAAAQVVFVPMNGDEPATGVNWNDPRTQWRPFFTGFQRGPTARIGRPAGVAVGPNGSLFVADDATGNIYRIRPRPR